METRARTGNLVLRLAKDEDAETIANLCAACRYEVLELADWSRIYPYWVVAELAGLIVGAAQVAVSRPVGRIEFLAVEPEFGHRDRAVIVRALADQAMATLRAAGCQLASFMIPDELGSYRAVLEKRGAVEMFHGTTLVKRLS